MRLSLIELLSLTLRSQFSVLGKGKYLRALSLTQHIHHTRARVWSQYRAQARFSTLASPSDPASRASALLAAKCDGPAAVTIIHEQTVRGAQRFLHIVGLFEAARLLVCEPHRQ